MIKIVDINDQNKQEFIDMCNGFYHSDAVMHAIPNSNIVQTASDIIAGTPFARCVLIEIDGACAGYALLAFSYSNEAGGMVVLLDELLVKSEYRGKGIGKEFFKWLYSTYDATTKRYRLEVSRDNKRVCDLYHSLGFEDFDYLQMVREL